MKVIEKVKSPWVGVVLAAIGCTQALIEVYQTRTEIEARGKAADDEYIANTKDNQQAIQDVLTFCAQSNERMLERVILLEQQVKKVKKVKKAKPKRKKKAMPPPKSVEKSGSEYKVRFRAPQRAWEQTAQPVKEH
jgi:hypothetical protein